MVQILPQEQGWGDVFRDIGSGAVQGYTNRADENALRASIERLGDNPSARDILNAITNTKTYSPDSKQTLFKNYLGAEQFGELQRHAKEQERIAQDKVEVEKAKKQEQIDKQKLDRAKTQSIVDQLNLPEEQKQALRENLSLSAAEDLMKTQVKSEADQKLAPFERKVQEANAEEYIKLGKEIPNLESTLQNIDHVKQLSQNLGILGMAGGALGVSPSAKEMEGVGFALIEPIVKIFNPSGPIAQQKLKTIQDKYAIKSTDTPSNRAGKLAALERFAKQAMNRAQEKMALIKRYNGNPPDEVIKEFDVVSDTISDAMLDYSVTGEEVVIEGAPDPAKFKGKTVTSPDGQKLRSDGTRWVKA